MTRLAGFLSAFWVALIPIGAIPSLSCRATALQSAQPIRLESRFMAEISVANEPRAEEKAPSPPAEVEDLTEPDPNQPADGETPPEDEVSIGEIPVVQMVELTLDTAKKRWMPM